MADTSHSSVLQGKQIDQLVRQKLTLLSTTSATFGTVTLPDLGGINVIDNRFELKTLGAETMALTGSCDGTNFEAGSLLPYTAADGLIPASAALVDGVYIIPKDWPYKAYKFVKSSTSAVAICAFSTVYIEKF